MDENRIKYSNMKSLKDIIKLFYILPELSKTAFLISKEKERIPISLDLNTVKYNFPVI